MGKALQPSLRFAPAKVQIERRADGAVILRSPLKLGGHARAVGEWLERWARETLFPEELLPPIRADDVDVLVLIGAKETTRGGAIDWTEPPLAALKERLTRRTVLRRDSRDLEIWERP